MANKKRQFSEEFKRDAVQYVQDHPDLTLSKCAEHLGIDRSTLSRWKTEVSENTDTPVFIGSGNHGPSETEKEN